MARGKWCTAEAGRACRVPRGHGEPPRRRPSRRRGWPGQQSAGLRVPRASPRKLGEREGARLQAGDSQEVGRSECPTARNGAGKVRNRQSALYRKAKPEKAARVYRVYDKGWREEVRWEAGRQGTANPGAPGIEGKGIAESVATGQEEARSEKRQTARRAHGSQCAPVRGVESPNPQGGPRPLGSAPVEARVGQTALKRV